MNDHLLTPQEGNFSKVMSLLCFGGNIPLNIFVMIFEISYGLTSIFNLPYALMAIAPGCNLLMNIFCIYMIGCNVQLAIRCNVCCMILFSLVTAGNLLVNGWLSYMMLAPISTYDSAISGGLDMFNSAVSGLSNLAGATGLSSLPGASGLSDLASTSLGLGGFSFLANSSFQKATSYMAPVCIMIGILTLFGNIFYGVYICKMRNLQSNTSQVQQIGGNIGVNRGLAGNNDIEMKRLQ
jgi:hypothetical protein